MNTLFLLNAPVLTTFGEFVFRPVSVAEARRFVTEADDVVSAVGHEATAEIMSRLLGIEVRASRIEIRQPAGSNALIFRLKQRPGEGKILTEQELEAIGFEFALLTKTLELQ